MQVRDKPLTAHQIATSLPFHKNALRARLNRARHRTDELFELLDPKVLYQRPVAERHRIVFYLGHLEAFDWNQACRKGLGASSFHASFDHLFEAGIDPEPGQGPVDTESDWPPLQEIRDYNRMARQHLDALLPETPDERLERVIEHREMHAETFAYLLHNLPQEHKRVSASAVHFKEVAAGANPSLEIPAGAAWLGAPRGEFGWDNEFERHAVDVAGFRISKFKITNREYLGFAAETGVIPHFWRRRGDSLWWRGMFTDTPLPLDHPVMVTHEEASAYAAWRGMALPSEEQYQRAAYGSSWDRYPWGDHEPGPHRGNFDFYSWGPTGVASTPGGDSRFGVSQLVGNGWEWTSSLFEPFAGFRPMEGYEGYSQPFFDGDHYVVKGGSWRTARGLLRASFRNWYRPKYRYVYATFRLASR
ncbi:MAG TPA: SUMF1/EgtB/PvdO family nonheme iron enzyme [Bryobacteraceae bacterium]|nr:SUMF1/EgtB/PvdO family nonheme iron enzyme [Bryobacteraceae bacterium]